MHTNSIYLAVVVLFFYAYDMAADTGNDWASDAGHFRISIQTELDPIEINRIHAWTVTIHTADGEPVSEAELTVTGGMPIHDHGMPTRPRVTDNLGDGRYRLEGMRFHMNGQWEVSIAISVDGISDTVTIALDL